ncbi:Membrane protein of unknown function [Peptoclostridium litorale DSM 5388]|uniref:DUF340 domain-containing protein n=1 Tax=Peptoclostridium litorale DSM 5388 TaxID=1121324 RepID=A0A069R9L3_PEPLI|nr:LysO family transporter [Peptoclostridium litorale]KDR93754.1 hypothetical protein CLIT_23c00260 [Peptoclostridium litorale DSM 5388]SIN85201.1 Membrane protein of unknown function [Peptoclostridium litorale DSM 5388]
MWTIILFLFGGISIGYFRGLDEKSKKLNSKMQQLGVVFLLFSMGCSIGANDDIIRNISKIGKISVSFALLTSLFSVACVFVVSLKFLKGAD